MFQGRLSIAGMLTTVEKGDGYSIPYNVEHGQLALERTVSRYLASTWESYLA